MNRTIYLFLPFLAIALLAFQGTGAVRAAELKGRGEKPRSGPMEVKSRTLEVDNLKSMVTFKGEVHAKRDDFVITCETLHVYYENLPSGSYTQKGETRIKKIIALGKVKIMRAQGGLATAEKAVYNEQADKVVLTGNPAVKWGNDLVQGEKITIFIKENRSIVEGSRGRKVRATIFPQAKKR